MATLYFDCFSGAAGDMIVGALIDAGAEFDRIRTVLDGLHLSGYQVAAEKLRKQGFAATQFHVHIDADAPQPHRHLRDIRKILEQADLDAAVRATAEKVFVRLADAEATAHGIDIEKVHFHEVGAVDSIVDIVAAVAAIQMLGASRICCSPIVTGVGTVKCDHGVMPVPAPATAYLLRGVPLAATDHVGELVTPTAAALLAELCDQFGVFPEMAIERIGMGAGVRENADRPNLLRVLVGDSGREGYEIDAVAVLEANLDDCSGEWVGHCVSRLLDAGVRDVFTSPISMKKGRAGLLLTVLCDPARADEYAAMIFAETTTFGVRRHLAQRTKLRREVVTVETSFGAIRIKCGFGPDGEVIASAEYDDCAAAAKRSGAALREVMDAALAVWRSLRE